MNDVEITSLRPVQLVLRNIGPFRGERPTLVRFLGPHADTLGAAADADDDGSLGADLPNGRDRGRSPANMFLILADNGDGKTSMLETMHGLFDLMSVRPEGRFVAGNSADAQAQLDLRAGVAVDGAFREILLSIWFGTEGPLVDWQKLIEKDYVWQARTWARIGFMPGRFDLALGTDQLGHSILAAIRRHEGSPQQVRGAEDGSSSGTGGRSSLRLRPLPGILYFPTDRNLGRRRAASATSALPSYRPGNKFDTDERRNEPAVETVLNAIGREDAARLDEILVLLNAALLVHPERPKSIVWDHSQRCCRVAVAGGVHDLSALSDGERSLLAFHARVLIHMTQATIVLVDEVDIHVHPKWTNSLYDSLKQIVSRFPGTTLIFTTHSRELAKAFDHRRMETGIVKGGLVAPKGLFG